MWRRIVLAGVPRELLSLSMLSSAAEVAPMACRSRRDDGAVGDVAETGEVALQDPFDVAFEEPRPPVGGASLDLRVAASGEDFSVRLAADRGVGHAWEGTVGQAGDERLALTAKLPLAERVQAQILGTTGQASSTCFISSRSADPVITTARESCRGRPGA